MSMSQCASLTGPCRRYDNDHGIALIAALMFLVVLTLLSLIAANVVTMSSQISGNYKASIQAFQAAEAGAEEARARLRANAANPIADTAPTQTTWQTYIGSATPAQAHGYTTGTTQQTLVASRQTALQYTVVITHATDSSGHLLYWGDPTGSGTNTRNTTTGQNIYLITSYGPAGGANSIVQTQVARVPPLPIPGTVYVDEPTTLQGSSTYINGQDSCGTHNLPGVATPLATTTNGQTTITQNGHPQVLGSPAIAYSGHTVNVAALVNALKGSADYAYTVSSATVTGMSWGTPTAGATQHSALACSVSHTVYYNTGGTHVKLSGGTQGCGLLLIDGDLEINGGFLWYGPVLVTGSITYTGGGNKNITGALLSGASLMADVIGGNATILNCSQAILNPTQNRPLLVLNWGQL